MKHIKLFEQISSELPKVFTREEIKNMTQEEFFKVMEMYYREHNSSQAFTLMQIMLDSKPDLKNDFDFMSKLGKYVPFIDTDPTTGSRGNKMADLSREIGLENRKASAIDDLSKEILRDEEILMRKKARLAEITKRR